MIVGMDFGTTNSGMAVYDGHKLQLVPLDPTNRNPYVARTSLYITNDRFVHIGRGAIDTYYQQNLNRPSKLEMVRVGEIELTFAELPTFIRDVYIERDVYSPGRLFLSFKMGLSSENYLGTIVGTHYFFLEDIIATYLYVTRRRAETFLNQEIDSIVLGRPVRFSDDDTHNDLARERLLQAAFRAGYKKVYLQYEPIAAAYYYETTIDKEQNVLIFDFGGGTLDISVIRVGNPKTRQVLANGGIPIAGDVFDRKIVRSKLPQHFGEGTTYRDTNQELPVPSSFYAAFSDWQTMLALQMPNQLEALRQIERTASNPRKIRALISLITSSYSLKLYDLVENHKRALSSEPVTTMKFDGPGFSIRQLLTRSEFESIIRSDTRAIAERLDSVLDEAGLQYKDIDAVIRTGGSSQIPVFIQMLEERFGAEKVKDIDAFSSVTSGLGILAHHVKLGDIDMRCYTPETQSGGDYLNSTDQNGIPVVDLGLMKKLIDVSEGRASSGQEQQVLITSNPDKQMKGFNVTAESAISAESPVELVHPEAQILLLTSEYRSFLKTAQQMADMEKMGIDLREIDGLHEDAFGKEAVTAIIRHETLQNAEFMLLISGQGYAKRFIGETLFTKLAQPVPYEFERLRGFPAQLVSFNGGDELVIITNSGRALRIHEKHIGIQPSRLVKTPRDGDVVGAFATSHPQEIIIATASGYAQRISSAAIPLTAETGGSGEKVTSRSNVVVALPFRQHLHAITNCRIVPVDASAIPLIPLNETTSHKILKLKQGETLLGLR